jgi:hypothetical protein
MCTWQHGAAAPRARVPCQICDATHPLPYSECARQQLQPPRGAAGDSTPPTADRIAPAPTLLAWRASQTQAPNRA